MDMIVLDLRHRRRTRLDEPASWTGRAALDRLATTSRSVAKANPEFTSGATGSVCDETDIGRVLPHMTAGERRRVGDPPPVNGVTICDECAATRSPERWNLRCRVDNKAHFRAATG